MTTLYRAVAILDSRTGFAEDDVQFGLVVNDPTDRDPDDLASLVADSLQAAFDVAGPGGLDLSEYMSAGLSRDGGANTLKVYDITGQLDGSDTGSPAGMASWALPTNAPGTSLPHEVALCVTIRADNWDLAPIEAPDGADAGTKPDRPRQRYTNRIYLGPLDSGANASLVAGQARPKTDFVDTALNFLSELQDLLLADDAALGVWSKADATVRQAVEVQADNAWDTQRRRGIAPTFRDVLSLAT